MDQRKFKKPAKTRRRQRSRTEDLHQPLNLMQLMRRRSRYRPYSVNNTSNRSALGNFPFMTNNSPNLTRGTYRLNREEDYFSPLFEAIDSLERHDRAVNTETHCCDWHSRNSINGNRNLSGNVNDLQQDYEAQMMEFNEDLQELHDQEEAEGLANTTEVHAERLANTNEVPENLENLVESSNSEILGDSQNLPHNPSFTTLAPSKSKESKSPDGSSTDYSGSSISYSERGLNSKQQNISDIIFPKIPGHLEPFMFGQPQVKLHRISRNFLTLREPIDLEENQQGETSRSSISDSENPQLFKMVDVNENYQPNPSHDNDSLKDLESIETLFETQLGSIETVANSPKTVNTTSQIFEISDNSETERLASDNDLTKQESREEPREANTESEDSIIPDLSIVNDLNMISSMELQQSSSDTIDTPITTRFAFVEAQSNASTENNASGSSLNNEEDTAPTAATDTEAGGDGLHNDSSIHIEFTITAIVNDNNEGDSNESEDNEDEVNNEEI